MSKDSTVTNFKPLTNFFDCQAAHNEFKNFSATRCQYNGGHIFNFYIFIELV